MPVFKYNLKIVPQWHSATTSHADFCVFNSQRRGFPESPGQAISIIIFLSFRVTVPVHDCLYECDLNHPFRGVYRKVTASEMTNILWLSMVAVSWCGTTLSAKVKWQMSTVGNLVKRLFRHFCRNRCTLIACTVLKTRLTFKSKLVYKEHSYGYAKCKGST